jgi:uncharacterized pyridoxal phosphate-containing UPF0001 family protein
MSIVENYKSIISKINHLSNKVTLICVTKTFSLDVIKPLVDNSDLIKKSPLSYGQVSSFKKNPIINNTYSFVGRFDESKPVSIDEETNNFKNWLSELWEKPKTEEKPKENKEPDGKFLNGEEYRPAILI